jgi:uncharacterized membrane protein YgcG
MNRTPVAVLLAAVLVLTAVSPAVVSAQESTDTTGLDFAVTQDPVTGNATVTLTNGSTAVSGATVNVTPSVTYAVDDQYTTDASGTFELPNPEQTVDVELEATVNGTTVTETVTLVPVEDSIDVAITQDDGGAVQVTVTQYGEALESAEVDVSSTVAYAGNGSYTTDANGTVALPEPDVETELTVVVTSGDFEEFTTATVGPVVEFEVGVETNADGTATVTVTRDDEPVDNATVTVTSDIAYAGNGSYTTDANGTVALSEPTEAVEIDVTASEGDDEATTTAQLGVVDTGLAVDVVQNADGTALVTVTDDGSAADNVTVNVTSDVAYAGSGSYTTDTTGTVDLPTPEQNVTVTVTAVNGSEEATATAELTVVENGGFENFGLWVSSYVDQLKNEGYFGKEFGQKVSEFATENNPGADKKPEHAGPPEDEAESDDTETEDDDEQSTDEAASNAAAKEDADGTQGQGPPEHATNAKQDAETSDDSDSDCNTGESDESCDDDETEETDESDDDKPGDSGNRGNGGNGGSNGGGNGGSNGSGNGGGNGGGNGRGK